MPSTLHIASGDAAAVCIRQALGCEDAAVLVHHDVVSCGRLARFESIEQWRQLRGEFWLPIVQVAAYDEGKPQDQKARAFEVSNHDVLECAGRLADADTVMLWLGTALSDQLLLAWTVHLFQLMGVALEKLELVQLTALPGDGRELLGIGLLSPAQLREHQPAPVPLQPADVAEAGRVWDAITGADPRALLAVLASPITALPALRRALRSVIGRFPDLHTGLPHWDAALLGAARALAAGETPPTAKQVVGHAIRGASAYLDPVGDFYLYERLRRLADPGLAQPALLLQGAPDAIRAARVTLSPTGLAVLEGRANFVALNGVDDWVGGMHLSAPGTTGVWFARDDGSLQLL